MAFTWVDRRLTAGRDTHAYVFTDSWVQQRVLLAMEHQNCWGMDILEFEGPVQALNSEVTCHSLGTLAKRLDLFGTVFVACKELFILGQIKEAAGILGQGH